MIQPLGGDADVAYVFGVFVLALGAASGFDSPLTMA